MITTEADYYSIFTKYLRTVETAEGALSAVDTEFRNACLTSILGRDDTVARYSLRPARMRTRNVTRGGNVVRLAGGPSRAKREASIGRRGFRNRSRDAQLLNRVCKLWIRIAEAEPRTPELCSGSKAENTRALR